MVWPGGDPLELEQKLQAEAGKADGRAGEGWDQSGVATPASVLSHSAWPHGAGAIDSGHAPSSAHS